MAILTPRIPPELLRHVVESLENDKKSLCSISLSSSRLRKEGQRVLFQNVIDITRIDTHLKFLHTISSSPGRLALLVHEYRHIFADYFNGDVWELFHPATKRDLPDSTRDALGKMHNLKRLELRPVYQYSPSWLLSECVFSLERLDWNDAEDVVWLIKDFLPRQVNPSENGLEANRTTLIPILEYMTLSILITPYQTSTNLSTDYPRANLTTTIPLNPLIRGACLWHPPSPEPQTLLQPALFISGHMFVG